MKRAVTILGAVAIAAAVAAALQNVVAVLTGVLEPTVRAGIVVTSQTAVVVAAGHRRQTGAGEAPVATVTGRTTGR